jgi:hypothetical protein
MAYEERVESERASNALNSSQKIPSSLALELLHRDHHGTKSLVEVRGQSIDSNHERRYYSQTLASYNSGGSMAL